MKTLTEKNPKGLPTILKATKSTSRIEVRTKELTLILMIPLVVTYSNDHMQLHFLHQPFLFITFEGRIKAGYNSKFICLKVEIQVRKLFCVNKAMPALPINVEDAARSDVEIEKALQVHSLVKTSLSISPVIPTYLSVSIRRCYQLAAYLQSA